MASKLLIMQDEALKGVKKELGQGGASWLDRVGPRLTAMTRRELVEQPVVEQQTAFEGQAVAEQPSSKLLAYEQPAADERTVELAATEQRST
ncbi:hypothetical protein R6Q59_013595 [Mikania micrantha]